MISLHDYELDRSIEQPLVAVPPRRRYTPWTIAMAFLLGIIGGVAYYLYPTNPSPLIDTPAESKPPMVQQPQARSVAAADVVLPPLTETDTLVRQFVGGLSSHATVMAWLATKGLIANFTVVTLNIAEGRAPTAHLRSLAPRAPFRTKESGGAVSLDPRSYERYDGYGEAMAALDATGAASLYVTLKPRILDAYRELGSPNADFDPVLERAIGQLLNVPVVEGNIALQRKVASYAFADPRLEALSPAQRQFLRMGPRNVQAVQAKLREIAALLNLHPEGDAAR